jgi:C1A family cysteine protease
MSKPEVKRVFNLKICHLKPEHLIFHNFNKSGPVVKLPLLVDLRPNMTPIKDQGQLGSCTAFALGACVENYYKKQKVDFKHSELFTYYNERVMDNSVSYDAGAYLSDGVKCLQSYGACSNSLWPYIQIKFKIRPNNSCYIDAEKRQALIVKNIKQDLISIKTCLSLGIPFVIGIAVYSSFMSLAVSKTGIVPMPNTLREQFLGGHAITCVGYDDSKKVFYMRNSWGTGWGNKGYFTLPYNYLLDPRLSTDIWATAEFEKF